MKKRVHIFGAVILATVMCGTVIAQTVSPEQIAEWREAAEQGNVEAQFSLGFAYWNGGGVDVYKRAAVRWYRKAAEQGNARAQNNFGYAYYNGEGVITDEREAFIWYSIAAANSNEMAADNLRDIPWRFVLFPDDIREVRKEAARRMEAIDKRE